MTKTNHSCSQETRISQLDKAINVALEGQSKDIQYIKDTVDSILAQAQKTNGRVNNLEGWKELVIQQQTTQNEILKSLTGDNNKFKTWKTFLTGAWAVVTAVVIPMAFFIVKDYVTGDIPSKILTYETRIASLEKLLENAEIITDNTNGTNKN